MLFILSISVISSSSFASKLSTTSSPGFQFQCQNGEVSSIESKIGWFGSTSCENKTLICEKKSHCCPKPSKTTKRTSIASTTSPTTTVITTFASGNAESVETSASPSTISTASPDSVNCEKCDLAARHSCFLSLHIETSESMNPYCEACENCCDDALPHKCDVWKNHDFCDMTWYSKDMKFILCGKTCGLC